LKQEGSLIYMSPEFIKSKRCGRHTDWWAMGILAYELMTGCSPWSSLTDFLRIKYEILNFQVLPPESVSAPSAQFIRQLVNRDFRHRLGTARDSYVKRAPFFQGIDWSAMARGETAPAFKCGVASTDKIDNKNVLKEYSRISHTASHRCGSGAAEFTRESSKSGNPLLSSSPSRFPGLEKIARYPPKIRLKW